MTNAEGISQERDWRILHDRVTEILDQYGLKNALGDGDYWLLDENWGWTVQQLEFQNLNLLRPHIVRLLQKTLTDYPNWSITIRVDVVGKEKEWPGMGLVIYANEIVDELRRDVLPSEFTDIVFASDSGPPFKLTVMNGMTGKELEFICKDGATYQRLNGFLRKMSGSQVKNEATDPNRIRFYWLTPEELDDLDRFVSPLLNFSLTARKL